MKIAMVGAGGVGAYLGGLLERAGHQVALIGRREHLRALRESGLRVESVHGDFTLRPALATDRPQEVGPVELVIFTVKTYDTDPAAESARPLVGPDTAVLPLQNGVESVARLARHFGAGRVLGGAAWIVVSVAEPGLIRQESQVRRIVFGEMDGRETERVRAIRETLATSGFTVEVTDRIETVLWTKLLFIASIGGLTSLMRAPVGPILAHAGSRALLRRAMEEVEAVARARRLPLNPRVVDQTMAFAQTLEPATTSSMQRDVAAGRRSEHDALNGAVARAGRESGVPTPIHEFCWTCLTVTEAAERIVPRV